MIFRLTLGHIDDTNKVSIICFEVKIDSQRYIMLQNSMLLCGLAKFIFRYIFYTFFMADINKHYKEIFLYFYCTKDKSI